LCLRAGGASGVWGSGGRGVRGDHEGFGAGGGLLGSGSKNACSEIPNEETRPNKSKENQAKGSGRLGA
jgi:hypothetical protein